MPADRSASPGALVISLDLYGAWASSTPNGSRELVTRILELFEEREIHATWACVGLLFAHDLADARRFAPTLRPSLRGERRSEPRSAYELLDRGVPEAEASGYFTPELLADIAARPHQELASLGFSPYRGCAPDRDTAQFEAEVEAAQAIARRSGIRLHSWAFADDCCTREQLEVLARHGIVAYRGRRPGWAHRPTQLAALAKLRRGLQLADNFSLLIPDAALPLPDTAAAPPIEVPISRLVRPYDPQLRKLEPLRVHRLQSEMTTAAEAGRLYHLHLRPHELVRHAYENMVFLDNLLRNAKALAGRVGFRSLTMAELVSA